jgi:hypothetical protein
MDDKIGRLLHEVDRLLLHLGHSVPPEVAVTEEIRKLVDEIRQEREGLAGNTRFAFREPSKPA